MKNNKPQSKQQERNNKDKAELNARENRNIEKTNKIRSWFSKRSNTIGKPSATFTDNYHESEVISDIRIEKRLHLSPFLLC